MVDPIIKDSFVLTSIAIGGVLAGYLLRTYFGGKRLKEAEKKLIEVIAPLTEIDKAERKLAQLYAKLEETWNGKHTES